MHNYFRLGKSPLSIKALEGIPTRFRGRLLEKSRSERFPNSRPRTARGCGAASRLHGNDLKEMSWRDFKPPNRQPRNRVHGKRALATLLSPEQNYSLLNPSF